MYNKFTENDTIKNTGTGSIKFPVSSNIELWDNDEKRSYENLSRPIRNLFENSMETQFVLDKIQAGIKMNANAVLTGCELVVSELGSTKYVSVKPGLFYYDSKSYTVYPTPSIASRQLEKDLELETEDGIDFIKITYEGGKFKASISITKSLNPLQETITDEFDRGIDLLSNIKTRIIVSDPSLVSKFKSLENYALEPCFVIPITGTRYVNFNPSSKEIVLEATSSSLNFGSVTNPVATDNTNSRWVGLVEGSYKNDSITNVKLANMAKDTLKGNDAVPGDPKDLGKEDVVAMFNLVTMDSPQEIYGTKTFKEDQIIINTKKLKFKGATSNTDWNVHSLSDSKFEISENATPVISIIKGGGSVTVTNPVALSNTLTVSGVSTLNNSLEVDATGAEELIDLKGPTTITGVTLIKGGLTIGEISSGKTMTVIDPVALSNTLTVSGVSTLNNSLSVNATEIGKSIGLNGTTIITGETIVKGGNLTIGNTPTDGSMEVKNPVTLSNTLAVSGISTLNNSLSVNATETGKSIGLNGTTTITGDTAMTGKLTVTATAIDKSIDLSGPTTITGNFTVDAKASGKSVLVEGNTKIKSLDNGTIKLETPALSTTSKTFVIGSGSTNNIATDGSGIVFKSNTDKSFLWKNGTPEASSFTSSENLNLAASKTYKINDIDVLSSDALGAGVINSSLKKVGTIIDGTWSANTIAVKKGGTGQTSYTAGDLLIGKTDGGLGIAKILGIEGGVDVANGNGTITLNTPQPIATASSPTFVGLTLTGDLAVNGSAITTIKTTLDVLNTNLTGVLNFANVATTINMGEVADINIGKATDSTKKVSILNKTISTTSATGALVVSGGVGIGGNVFTDGNLTTTGKITSAGLQSTVTGASLEVATGGVNTTGNVKSIISSTKKFSIEKDGADGNLLSVEHDGITADVDINSSGEITSTKTITGLKFKTEDTDTLSDINSIKFNGNTINNGANTISDESPYLLWTDKDTGREIKKTKFTDFPIAKKDGLISGLMPASIYGRITDLEAAAGFTAGNVTTLVRTVNNITPAAETGDIPLYGSNIKLNKTNVSHDDLMDESLTSIYTAVRTLRTEKVRVKGHLPAGKVNTATFSQIIKKTKDGTAVDWGQITDDEIENTLTKVSPSSKKGNIANTTETIHKVAFWNNDEKSLLSHDDITYNTSSKTLIAETVSSRSSRKLKKDIELYEKSAFDTIDKIDIVSYHFIADETQTDRVGFIAEDSPELVSGKDRDHMEMNNCIGLLLKAVQELKQENAELRSLINDKNS